MFGDLQKMFTKFLHLTDPWRVSSVTVDDAETRVDIRVVCDGKPAMVCPDCGCLCHGYDWRKRARQHTGLFDMECHLHCAVDRARGYRDWRNPRTMCYLRRSGLCRSHAQVWSYLYRGHQRSWWQNRSVEGASRRPDRLPDFSLSAIAGLAAIAHVWVYPLKASKNQIN